MAEESGSAPPIDHKNLSLEQPLIPLDEVEPPVRTGTLVGSVFNLANAAIGAGVLAFPMAFSKTGIALGLGLCAFFAVALGYTLHVLARVTMARDCRSYQEAVTVTAGRVPGYLIMVSMTLYLFGACIAYLNVIFDQVHPVVAHYLGEGHWLAAHRFPVLALACALLLPLCLLRNISFLSAPSTVAVLSIVYMAVLVVASGVRALSGAGAAAGVVAARVDVRALQAIPIICFALQCHLVFVPVAFEMRARSLRAADRVIALAFAVCLALYVPVGVAGYAKFGDAVRDDVLESFASMRPAYTVARACIAVTATLSYPLLHFVARGAIFDLLGLTHQHHSPARWAGTAVCFMAATLAVAVYVPKISAQIFIFPGLMLLGDMPDKAPSDRPIGICSIAFGLVLGAACTFSLVRFG